MLTKSMSFGFDLDERKSGGGNTSYFHMLDVSALFIKNKSNTT